VCLHSCRQYLLFIQDHVTSKSKNEATGRVAGQEFQAPDKKLSANRDRRIRMEEENMKEKNLRMSKRVKARRNRLTWKFTCETEITLKNKEEREQIHSYEK
jgi:hypothetical protein